MTSDLFSDQQQNLFFDIFEPYQHILADNFGSVKFVFIL